LVEKDTVKFFQSGTKFDHPSGANRISLNVPAEKVQIYLPSAIYQQRGLFVIIVRIKLNALPEKRKELMQTLFSMIESIGKERGCLSHHVLRDIENENVFSLIDEWGTRNDLDQYISSVKFGILLGTKSLLCEPPVVQIHTVSNIEEMATIDAARDK
jgi:quinol monooxygenase YgiN